MKFSQEQIDGFKKKHGDVFEVTAGDMSCLLRKPTRDNLAQAMAMSKSDPLKMTEVILANTWLAGDEEIKSDLGALVGISTQIDQILEIKNSEIKKV